VKESSVLLEFYLRVRRYIGGATDPNSTLNAAALEDGFNRLALELHAFQRQANPVYKSWCAACSPVGANVTHWSEIPALPIRAFKEQEVTCLEPELRKAVFQSSGTTGQERSRHFHSDDSLALYEASLVPWFRKHLLPELDPTSTRVSEEATRVKHVVILCPPPAEARRSSLAHMFGSVTRGFGDGTVHFCGSVNRLGAWELDWENVEEAMARVNEEATPVLMLGTAFLFVHLLDELLERGATWKLPAGSRLLETGGYKGRSRELSKESLHAALAGELAVSPAGIVCEYGMSELSSQAYDREAFAAGSAPRAYRFPPWARAQVLSPESGREVSEGQTGVLKVVDLANAASVLAIQTEDLATRRGDGFEWVGRVEMSEPRGCSLRS
jgi:hypothetical protein